MLYRRDIDGLRAIAVLTVIFFHAGFKLFSGGFVGVDVFFVISGYLITSIILRAHQTGRYTWHDFYIRRARRILPALFFVILVCLPLSWHWFLPGDLKDFGQSVVATTLFSSNLFFWLKTGYFDIEAEFKPLLHTWSLAVEEQYYLFFPLLLSLCLKNSSKAFRLTLIFLVLASLAWAQFGSQFHPSANFFLFPSRIWELGIGALIALYLHNKEATTKSVVSERVHPYLTVLGFVLILISVFSFNQHLPYPSLYTLVPVAGTGLIILFSNEKKLIGSFLSSRILVALGLISYSAYLWHQPLFAFTRYRTLGEISTQTAICIIVVTFVVASLSWRFIESPFRRGVTSGSNIKFALLAALLSLGFVVFGVGAHYTDGYASIRTFSGLPASYLNVAQVDRKIIRGVDGALCVSNSGSLCQVSASPVSDQNILLLGDSHSADLTNQFKLFADQHHINAWQMSFPGCGFMQSQVVGNSSCAATRELILNKASAHAFTEIFLIGNYFVHTQGRTEFARAIDINSLRDFIEALLKTGTKVVFFVPRITFNYSPTRAAILTKLPELVPLVDPLNDAAWLAGLSTLKNQVNFVMFDQANVLIQNGCGSVDCFNGHTKDMMPLYRDQSHLTEFGSSVVFDAFRKSRNLP